MPKSEKPIFQVYADERCEDGYLIVTVALT